MEVKMIARTVQVLGLEENGKVIGGFTVNLFGRRGYAYGMEGAGFYRVIKERGYCILDTLGIDEISAHMTPAATRLCTRRMSDRYIVTVKDGGNVHGLVDYEVTIGRKNHD